MKKLSQFFINNPKISIILSFLLLVYGLLALKNMTAESYPSVDFAMATVETIYKGASSEDIEAKITKPIEDEIRSVGGIKDVRSISQAGRSFIFVRADIDGKNVRQVMNDLQKAIDRVSDLPMDLQDAPKFTELKSEEMPVLSIVIIGSNESRYRDQIAEDLKEEIEDNKDVLRVTFSGLLKRQFQIQLNKQKMDEQHIGVTEVLSKIQSRNVNTPGGDLKDAITQKLVRIEGKIKNAEELKEIPIRSNFTGQQIYLKDIATVDDSMEEPLTIARYNGTEATIMIVTKKAGTDTIKLVTDINKKIDVFKDKYKDLNFVIYKDEGIKVVNKLNILKSNALSGFLLVVIILFIFLPMRIGIAACFSLPLAIIGTFGIMNSMGINLNSVSILALVIALGMLVDNSVVISENFSRLKNNGALAIDAAFQSIGDLWLPITATALTTIAAFIPMLITRGLMGQFIKAIPLVVSAALLLSLAESFILLPVRLVYISGNVVKNINQKSNDWFYNISKRFERMMSYLIKHRYVVLIAFIGIIFISLTLMTKFNNFVLFPVEQTEEYWARVEMNKGTKLQITHQKLEEISNKIKDVLQEYAVHIVAQAGTSNAGLKDMKGSIGNDQGVINISVSDYAKFSISHIEILDKLRNIQIEGIKNISFEAVINGPPVGNPIEATFRSNDLHSLNNLLDETIKDLEKIKGIQDISINDVSGNDEVFVEIDYKKADRLGLSVKQISDTISIAISGKIASNVTLLNKKVDLRITMLGSYKKNIDDLKKLLIMDNQGNLVPVMNIASFKVSSGALQRKRLDFKQAKTLNANVDEKFITSHVANQKLQEIFKKYNVTHPDVSLIFGGQAESTKESIQSLFEAEYLSAICIFGLLVFLFKSFLRPFIIMSTIPLGLFGFSISFCLHQKAISFMALIGIIGLGGIIVNSGIVLISFIDQMRKETTEPLHTILAQASSIRLKAVLVTSLTTIGGLLPTAYGIGGKDATLIPMTLAMAWGLTSGTLLTLAWVPCLYAIIEDVIALYNKIVSSVIFRIREKFTNIKITK